jgi:hypothetical protein
MIWVMRSRLEEDGVLLRVDAQLRVEGVVPDLLHVLPVGHNPVLERVLDEEDAAARHRRVADVLVLLAGADHDALLLGRADDGGEDRLGRVLAGNTGLAAARAVVDDDRSLRHGGCGGGSRRRRRVREGRVCRVRLTRETAGALAAGPALLYLV